MKKAKKYIRIFVLAIVLSGFAFLTSCGKDRSMEAVITVKLMSDTMVVVPQIRVEMSKDDVDIVGYTDDNGEFRYTFEQPVQLDIKAYNDTVSGIGVINVGEYGYDYSKTVFVF